MTVVAGTVVRLRSLKGAPTRRTARKRTKRATEATRGRAKPARPAVLAEPEDEQATERPHPALRVIGIGASAGGLEALETLLHAMPDRTGAAFVIVQHLDRTHNSLLAEILQHKTGMTVLEASDRMRVEPDHVYVNPPGHDVSLLHGTLQLLPQSPKRSAILPIDFFFRSLAQDLGDRSIGVILSGMGLDGTLGLRAIKEAGGATFVQEPDSARFNSMPRGAVDAGVADIIASASELPARILSYCEHASLPAGGTVPTASESAVEKICVLLREHSGNDFSVYKRSTIYRRIERRMSLHQIVEIADYVQFLRENPREVELLFKELLIGVTSFFRDPVEWERLRTEVLPSIVEARASTGVIRAWVAGCSTGEEAYSLAIVLKETVDAINAPRRTTVQVFATDLDPDAIERARHGLYPETIAADVTPERLARFFVREDTGYRVSKQVRESVVFAPQNLIVDPPFTKVDVISCRNVMIYLSPEVQRKLIPMFHYCLNVAGALFLGTAETVGQSSELFSPVDGRARIYRRREIGRSDVSVELPISAHAGRVSTHVAPEDAPPTKPSLQSIVDRLLVQRFAPLGILCNAKGDILYISARAGKYLEPAVGKANLNILAMARENLRFELSRGFTRLARRETALTIGDVIVGTNGGAQHVSVKLQRLTEPKEVAGAVFIVITDTAAPPKRSKLPAPRNARGIGRVRALETALERARDEAQTVREEMQTSQEELKSTNEELQSTNEELQSANEELTTSKEEMQSLNEELQTVNNELQSKVDELSRSNNDMKNLLNSTDIATLFLDGELRIRRFTTATAKIIKLIPTDVGRPITDIASDLDYLDLVDDARDVLRTLIFKQRQVVTHDGRAFAVRIMPYRTLDNVIDGLVVTFLDTTPMRALELRAIEQSNSLRQLTESLPALIWSARPDGAFDFISVQWTQYVGTSDAELLLWGWLEYVHPSDRERVRASWRTAVGMREDFAVELRLRSALGTFRWFQMRASPVRTAAGEVVKWYGTSSEIDPLKRAEDQLNTVLEELSEGIVQLDADMRILRANTRIDELTGRAVTAHVGASLFDVLPEARELADKPRASMDVEGARIEMRTRRDTTEMLWLFVTRSAS